MRTIRRDEQLSAECLCQHLKNTLACDVLCSAPAIDPPDFRLDIMRPDGVAESWAVEVTGLYQQLDYEGKPISRSALDNPVDLMCIRLTRRLQPLTRGYIVVVQGPMRIGIRELEKRIVHYVQKGEDKEAQLDFKEAFDEEAATVRPEKLKEPAVRRLVEETVRMQCVQRCRQITIRAAEGIKEIVAVVSSGGATVPGDGALVSDLHATLRYAIPERLNEKTDKMRSVNGYKCKVLVIWSAIPQVTAEDVRPHVINFDPVVFDAVYFIENPNPNISQVFGRVLL